jgi:membrane associated rhomboid family serine protease
VVVFACIAGLGVLAERIFGRGRRPLLYLGCGVVGPAFGYLWEPPDAGASVAAGLLGAVSAWLLSPAGPHLARVPVFGGLAAWTAVSMCQAHVAVASTPATPMRSFRHTRPRSSTAEAVSGGGRADL